MPRTLALSFHAVHRIAAGEMPEMARLLGAFEAGTLLCVRPSSEDPDWGGPGAVLNIGINDARFVELSEQIGKRAASVIYLRFVLYPWILGMQEKEDIARIKEERDEIIAEKEELEATIEKLTFEQEISRQDKM